MSIEDDCRVRTEYADENFAILRHIVLNLIRQNKSKGSIITKRHRAAWSDDHLLALLQGEVN